MTCLSFSDIFYNAMHFDQRDALLYRTAIRFSLLFRKEKIRYYIVGAYALIFHQVVRNTMDIDILVHENDFAKAYQIFLRIGYTKTLGDSLCARFQHPYFLSVDLFVSPMYGPFPTEANTIEYEQNIIFCTIPVLVLTKIKAFIGRPRTEKLVVKKMMDQVDIISLMLTHQLDKEYAKNNNFNYIEEYTYEKNYAEYFNQFITSPTTKKKKKFNCICQ